MTKRKKGEESDEICSICLDDIHNGLPVVPTECGHNFHEKCLVKHCYINKTCPLCRSDITEDCDILIEEDTKENQKLIERYANLLGLNTGSKSKRKKSKKKKKKSKKKRKKRHLTKQR